jgi:hypothetical protein
VDPFTAADPASGTMSVLEMSASGWAGMPVDVVGGGG